MKTYADRIVELKDRHAEQVAEIEKQAALAAQLPEAVSNPYMIHFALSDCPWISYHVETLGDALVIMRAFPAPLDVAAISDGCLSIAPVGRHSERYLNKPARWSVSAGIEIAQHGGKGFFTATVAFWCAAAGRDCIKVVIEVKQFPRQYRASMNARYDMYGNVTQAEFRDSALKDKAPGARVKYSGGSRDAFDIRYYFSPAGFEVVAKGNS